MCLCAHNQFVVYVGFINGLLILIIVIATMNNNIYKRIQRKTVECLGKFRDTVNKREWPSTLPDRGHHLLEKPEYWLGATDLEQEGTWVWDPSSKYARCPVERYKTLFLQNLSGNMYRHITRIYLSIVTTIMLCPYKYNSELKRIRETNTCAHFFIYTCRSIEGIRRVLSKQIASYQSK